MIDKVRIHQVALMLDTFPLSGATDRVQYFERVLSLMAEFQGDSPRIVGLKAQVKALQDAVDTLTNEVNNA